LDRRGIRIVITSNVIANAKTPVAEGLDPRYVPVFLLRRVIRWLLPFLIELSTVARA